MRNATEHERFCYVCKTIKHPSEFPERPYRTRWGTTATKFIGPCLACYESGHYWAIKSERPCNVCLKSKPAAEFYRHSYTTRTGKTSTRFMSRCKECHAQSNKQWAKAPHRVTQRREHKRVNRDRNRANSDSVNARKNYEADRFSKWKHALRKKYGITPELYFELLDKQGGVCAVCNRAHAVTPMGKQKLHVDHDHKTGRVRGLLCHWCNVAAGILGDSPDIAEKLTAYLRAANA